MLDAARCPKCNEIFIPPRMFCPKCRVKLENIQVKGVGNVLTFTTILVPPEGFTPPVYIVLVKLDSGVNLLCNTSKSCLHFNKRVIVTKIGDKFIAEPHNIFYVAKKKLKTLLRRREKTSAQEVPKTPS